MFRNIAMAAAAAALMAGPVSATTLAGSFFIDIRGDANQPTFTLRNFSQSSGVLISGFGFDIGDVTRNFDSITDLTDPRDGTSTLTTGDTQNGGQRTDQFVIEFTDFDSFEDVSFVVDIDIDDADTVEDFTTVFFGSRTATAFVQFDFPGFGKIVNRTVLDPSVHLDGAIAKIPVIQEVTLQMPGPDTDAAVPVPAALPLMALGLGALGLAARRRRG